MICLILQGVELPLLLDAVVRYRKNCAFIQLTSLTHFCYFDFAIFCFCCVFLGFELLDQMAGDCFLFC